MASVKAIAAIAVVAILVVAGVAIALDRDGGGGGSGTEEAIGNNVEPGSMYVLATSESGSGVRSASETTYEVKSVNGDILTVETTTGGITETTAVTAEDFLDDVSVVDQSYVGQYQRSETIGTSFGEKTCGVYLDAVSVGNGNTTVSTLEWIGEGTNIIYMTEITVIQNGAKIVERTTLKDTNMISEGKPPVTPSKPSGSESIRTDLVKGDYIEFSKYDDDGDRDIERLTVVGVSGNRVTITDDDGDWDDSDTILVSEFLSIIVYNGEGRQLGSETIGTAFGDIPCNIYEIAVNDGDDDDDRVVVWASVSDNVIYKIVSHDDYYDDDDMESYVLTGTSLFYAAPSDPVPPSGPSNAFDVDISVGDGYTIRDDDSDTERYEVIAIDGGRLVVKETDERGDVDIERMSQNQFLGEIMVQQSVLDRLKEVGNENVGSIPCTIYEAADDDRERIWVGPDNIVWKSADDDDDDTWYLVEVRIASL